MFITEYNTWRKIDSSGKLDKPSRRLFCPLLLCIRSFTGSGSPLSPVDLQISLPLFLLQNSTKLRIRQFGAQEIEDPTLTESWVQVVRSCRMKCFLDFTRRYVYGVDAVGNDDTERSGMRTNAVKAGCSSRVKPIDVDRPTEGSPRRYLSDGKSEAA